MKLTGLVLMIMAVLALFVGAGQADPKSPDPFRNHVRIYRNKLTPRPISPENIDRLYRLYGQA